jgi:cytochrome c oxidase subunit 2
MKVSGWLFSILASCALTAAIAADPDYAFCTVCHGAHGNGNPAINAPKIAGIEPWYLKRQLEHFRAGLRGTQPADLPGTEMQPVGLGLDDAAIEKVAAYVGTFEPQRPPATVTGNARRGRSLYESCAGCHGARGEGKASLQAPALAGQTDWYLVTQLERFRSGQRGFSPEDEQGTQMRAAAAVLPDDAAVKDIVAYINSLAAGRART